jgi:hypothetical protein
MVAVVASKLNPPATALTIPWTVLTDDALAAALHATAQTLTTRYVNLARRNLLGILAEVEADGLISRSRYRMLQSILGTASTGKFKPVWS